MSQIETKLITNQDILAALLVSAEVDIFPSDPKTFHGIIFSLQKEFPSPLDKFPFDLIDIHPFSNALEATLNWLRIARIIKPVGEFEERKYSLSGAAKRLVQEKTLPRFSESERIVLQSAGARLKELISTNI